MSDQPSTPDNPNQERLRRLAAHQQMLRERFPPRPRVRVLPRDDAARKALSHPHGLPFPKEGSVEWPLDRFTKRRLLDGSVTREDEAKQQQPAAREDEAKQQQPAAREDEAKQQQPATHRQPARQHQPTGN